MNILSGCDHLRFESHINHAVYAKVNGYSYMFDGKPRPTFSRYDHKLALILDLPLDDKWYFWLDDDAFFTSFAPIESLELTFGEELMIFPRSPVNPRGIWTYISSGNFFFKNTGAFKRFIGLSLSTNMEQVKEWWRESEHGYFTRGDQDKLVYQLLEKGWDQYLKLVPYDVFNTRPYHFKASTDEHFLCHFAGAGQGTAGKLREITKFKDRLSMPNLALVPHRLRHLEEAIRDEYSKQRDNEFRI